MSIRTEGNSFGDFKDATFHNALHTAQKGGQSSTSITVGTGGPSHSEPRSRNRKGKQPAEKSSLTLEDQIPGFTSPVPLGRKYRLKLIISHADTPFKSEAVPDTEEWCPTEEDTQYELLHGLYLTSCLGNIIYRTGLWDTFIRMKPDCTYEFF